MRPGSETNGGQTLARPRGQGHGTDRTALTDHMPGLLNTTNRERLVAYCHEWLASRPAAGRLTYPDLLRCRVRLLTVAARQGAEGSADVPAGRGHGRVMEKSGSLAVRTAGNGHNEGYSGRPVEVQADDC